MRDLQAATPHQAPESETVAAKEALWRVVRGEKVSSETLEMLRTLRLSAVKEILSERDGRPPRNPARPS